MRWLLPLMAWALVTGLLLQLQGQHGRLPLVEAAAYGAVAAVLTFLFGELADWSLP